MSSCRHTGRLAPCVRHSISKAVVCSADFTRVYSRHCSLLQAVLKTKMAAFGIRYKGFDDLASSCQQLLERMPGSGRPCPHSESSQDQAVESIKPRITWRVQIWEPLVQILCRSNFLHPLSKLYALLCFQLSAPCADGPHRWLDMAVHLMDWPLLTRLLAKAQT